MLTVCLSLYDMDKEGEGQGQKRPREGGGDHMPAQRYAKGSGKGGSGRRERKGGEARWQGVPNPALWMGAGEGGRHTPILPAHLLLYAAATAAALIRRKG